MLNVHKYTFKYLSTIVVYNNLQLIFFHLSLTLQE